MVEGARLESVFRGNSNVGSNPTLSASRINNLQNCFLPKQYHEISKRERSQGMHFWVHFHGLRAA